MLNRFLPKSLVGQLIALLAGVLIVAQIINLALLVGTQRIQARSNAYQGAIDRAVWMISSLPEDLPAQLPYELISERRGPQGAFFLSAVNGAKDTKGARDLPRYNVRFQSLLAERGVVPLQTSVAFLQNGPQHLRQTGAANEGFLPPPSGGLERRESTQETGLFQPQQRVRPRLQGEGGPTRLGQFKLQEIRVSAEIKEGVWFNAFMPHPRTEALTGRIVLATALLLSLSLLAAWIFARRLARPISEFTHAAERLGRGEQPEQLKEAGPKDVRQAMSAFNTMQARLTRMLDTQRTMLRAVGHDLRTPLTSLRLRAENIEDDIERDKVISTLNDMTIMTKEILSWAKDASGTEKIASVDLGAMLESMVDDYQDQGQNVVLQEFETFPVMIRRIAVKRALQNLINNALQYGKRAKLRVEREEGTVIVHVEDDGPGVSEEQLLEILKPFTRLEESRNKETGGTGLGLSIAETIAQIHGGTLVLTNRKPNGLRASFSLPI